MPFNPNHPNLTGFVLDNPFYSSRPNHQNDENIHTPQTTDMSVPPSYLEDNVSPRGSISIPVDSNNNFGPLVGDNNNTNYFASQTRLPKQAYAQAQAPNVFSSPSFFPRFMMGNPGAGPGQSGGMHIPPMYSTKGGFHGGYNTRFSAQYNNGMHGKSMFFIGESLQQGIDGCYYAPLNYSEPALNDPFFTQVNNGIQGFNLASAGAGVYGGFDGLMTGGFDNQFSAQGPIAQNDFFQPPQANNAASTPNIPSFSSTKYDTEPREQFPAYTDSEFQAPDPPSAPDYNNSNNTQKNPLLISLPATPRNEVAAYANMTDPYYLTHPYGPVNRTANVAPLPDEVSFPCPSSVEDLIDLENLKLQNEAVRSELASGQFVCDSFGLWSYDRGGRDSYEDEDEDTVTGASGGDAGDISDRGRDEKNCYGYRNPAVYGRGVDGEQSRRNEDTGSHPTRRSQDHEIHTDGKAECLMDNVGNFYETVPGSPFKIATANGPFIIKRAGHFNTITGLATSSSSVADVRMDNSLGNMGNVAASVTVVDQSEDIVESAGNSTIDKNSAPQTPIEKSESGNAKETTESTPEPAATPIKETSEATEKEEENENNTLIKTTAPLSYATALKTLLTLEKSPGLGSDEASASNLYSTPSSSKPLKQYPSGHPNAIFASPSTTSIRAIPRRASNFRRMREAEESSYNGYETSETRRRKRSNYQPDLESFSHSLHHKFLPDSENCALWVENLSKDITPAQLFDVIQEGPVFILYICPPSEKHATSAANLVFMTHEAAAAFLQRTVKEKIWIGQNQVWAKYNYTGYKKWAHPERTRVLRIKGPKHVMKREEWLQYFDSCVKFELETDLQYEVEEEGETKVVMEFRFVRVETQSSCIFLAFKKEEGYTEKFEIEYGPDPCDKRG